jgi:putative membrane protein
MRWLLHALISSAALVAIAHLYPGVQVSGWTAALVAAVALGIINVLVRPVLIVLTLPATILTLGLFLLVVNAICFWLAAKLIPGFAVSGLWAALVGSVLYSILTGVAGWLIFSDKNKPKS